MKVKNFNLKLLKYCSSDNIIHLKFEFKVIENVVVM